MAVVFHSCELPFIPYGRLKENKLDDDDEDIAATLAPPLISLDIGPSPAHPPPGLITEITKLKFCDG